eukprot:CAMPEP_0119012998 /NCGR_PEP_ID=MMETSP1176-20130426/7741_1 /TAXON_ID=265551 /ORGANISM="Synedropsis recta cf, Strain CCMP1620" /LENGTH=211 /DNA_ID=CAMNT_0006966043 /DNA_START=15 /DNA_END=650 /DNA_ORIENTATION=+
MNKIQGSPTFVLFLLLGAVTISHSYGGSPWSRWGSVPSSKAGISTDHGKSGLSSRTDFLRSVAVGAGCLLAAPSMAVAKTPDSASKQLQAGFDSLNREVKNIDRVVTKEAKKIDRAVTKETKKVTKKVKKDLKKADRVVTKESKKVMRKVEKETKVVKREANKLGNAAEQKTKAFVGGVLPPEAGKTAARKPVGIDVSKVKLCQDVTRKCL